MLWKARVVQPQYARYHRHNIETTILTPMVRLETRMAFVSICKQLGMPMLLILMLQKLAEVTKCLDASGTMVVLWDLMGWVPITICQLRSGGHVGRHLALLGGKSVDCLAGIVFS
jgi:hypothetical protein